MSTILQPSIHAHGGVPGIGPLQDAKLMIIGEAPAEHEVIANRPFVGPSGELLDHMLMKCGLPPRHEVYITNLIKERVRDNTNDDAMALAIEKWRHVLMDEIHHASNVKVFITLGRWATQWFMETLTPGYPYTCEMDWLHGIPRMSGGRWHVPCYHPAAGLHDPGMIPPTFADFRMVRRLLDGKYHIWTLRSPITITECSPQYWSDAGMAYPVVAIDTEGLPGHMWCMSLATSTGSAIVIRPHQLPRKITANILVMHNAPWDLQVLRAAGVEMEFGTLVDTMQLASYFNTEPQSLKKLAWRWLGMEMQEYGDLVGPYQNDVSMQYLNKLREVRWSKPEQRILWENGHPRPYKPRALNTGIDKIISDSVATRLRGGTANVLKRWLAIPLDVRAEAEKRFGPMPMVTLDDIPYRNAVDYAGRDADATWRLQPVLENGLKEVYGYGIGVGVGGGHGPTDW